MIGPERRQAADGAVQPLELERREFEQSSSRAQKQTTEYERRQGWIAQSVILLYIAKVIVLVAAYLLAPFSAFADRIAAGADRARELANTLLLPIVTLVLGYYFGKRAE